MRDVIQKVMATEIEAKHIVELAKAESDRILSDAQKKGEEIVAQARQEARVEAERIVATAIEAAEQEKQESLARITAEIESQVRLEQTDRQRVVGEVVRCLCKQG